MRNRRLGLWALLVMMAGGMFVVGCGSDDHDHDRDSVRHARWEDHHDRNSDRHDRDWDRHY